MTQQTWQIDPVHSNVSFAVRHMVVSKVRGRFSRFSAQFDLQGDDLTTARLVGRVEIASIDTHEEKRDAHLRSADFFDAERFPEMTFRSTRIERGEAEGELRVEGELTLRGVTRPLTLAVERTGVVRDPYGNDRAGFSARGRLNRKEFGLNWNQMLETGGLVVGDTVEIDIEVEAVRKEATEPARPGASA